VNRTKTKITNQQSHFEIKARLATNHANCNTDNINQNWLRGLMKTMKAKFFP